MMEKQNSYTTEVTFAKGYETNQQVQSFGKVNKLHGECPKRKEGRKEGRKERKEERKEEKK